MKIINESQGITIEYLDVPLNGKPLTRIWTEPCHAIEERAGETIEGRDEEISILIDSGIHHGWAIAPIETAF